MASYPEGPTWCPAKELLTPLHDIQKQDVHISDKHILEGLTRLTCTPTCVRAEQLRPSPSEGNGKIPSECWGLACIQKFYSLSGLTLLMRQRKHTAHGSETLHPQAATEAAELDAS